VRCRCVTFIVFVPGQSGGATPLFAASKHGHIEVVRALVGAGADVNQAHVRDYNGMRGIMRPCDPG
jgi:hypothetical protein